MAQWYFAYGSNLDPATFCGRRRIQPIAAYPGRLADFELCFNLAVGAGERGVANLARMPGAAVWGVVYRIGHDAARRLDRSEGVHHGFYRRAEITVDTGDDRIEAYTYLSSRTSTGRAPSARYLGLIVAGARHHGLPQAWIEHLTAWPLAIDEREGPQQRLL